MGLFENFPYTNFHELNLDWIIKTVKELGVKLKGFEDDIKSIPVLVESAVKKELPNVTIPVVQKQKTILFVGDSYLLSYWSTPDFNLGERTASLLNADCVTIPESGAGFITAGEQGHTLIQNLSTEIQKHPQNYFSDVVLLGGLNDYNRFKNDYDNAQTLMTQAVNTLKNIIKTTQGCSFKIILFPYVEKGITKDMLKFYNTVLYSNLIKSGAGISNKAYTWLRGLSGVSANDGQGYQHPNTQGDIIISEYIASFINGNNSSAQDFFTYESSGNRLYMSLDNGVVTGYFFWTVPEGQPSSQTLVSFPSKFKPADTVYILAKTGNNIGEFEINPNSGFKLAITSAASAYLSSFSYNAEFTNQ